MTRTQNDNIKDDMSNLSRGNLELLAYEIFDGYTRLVLGYKRMEGVVEGMVAFFGGGSFGDEGEEIKVKLQQILDKNAETLGEMTQAMLVRLEEEE